MADNIQNATNLTNLHFKLFIIIRHLQERSDGIGHVILTVFFYKKQTFYEGGFATNRR